MAFSFLWANFKSYITEISMFQSKLPVCKSFQEVFRKSTAVLPCRFSPSCVIIVIFDVNYGTFLLLPLSHLTLLTEGNQLMSSS